MSVCGVVECSDMDKSTVERNRFVRSMILPCSHCLSCYGCVCLVCERPVTGHHCRPYKSLGLVIQAVFVLPMHALSRGTGTGIGP